MNTTPTLVEGLVVVAGFVWDAMLVGVLPHGEVVPSVAGPGVGAVQHMLDRQVGRRPGSPPLNVDAVLGTGKQTVSPD